MPEHEPVIAGFLNRLVSAVSRSALLKATVSRTGRLLDCARIAVVDEGLPDRLLECVVSGKGQVTVALQLRPTYSDDETGSDGEAEERPVDKRYREHRNLYDTLDRRIQRFAELVKRETGVHSLWMGYPFLYIVTGEQDAQRSILAPIFLWPASIQLDHRHEGRILIGRDISAGSAKFNRAMARWISRELKLELNVPNEDELDGLALGDIRVAAERLRSQFATSPTGDLATSLEPLPSVKLLSPQQSPRLYNSAVLGVYRWQNDAIVADLETLKAMQEIEGVAAGFVSGRQLPCPAEAARPPELDRYQVYDADFSQDRVIWQARSEPGLVVHGPPGTGKSQTIVNIIADALAHDRTVLMVCQKYAATRVVFEKLKQVGLDGLCLEVPDGEKCRTSVFKAIRTQAEELPTALPPNRFEVRRTALANEISALERELDHYAKALHEKHAKVGISYREMKTIEGTVYTQFPTVRSLPALQASVANLSSLELGTICREVEQIGRLFNLADPIRNPWRHHLPTVRVTVGLGPDLQRAIDKLRQLDDQHWRQAKVNQGGIEICEDIAVFRDTAQHVITKFLELASDAAGLRTRVLRAWLLSRRSSAGGDASAHRERCKQACALAGQVASTPLPPAMHAICAEKSGYELKHIFAEARVALRYRDQWWRALSPQFRSARQQLQKLAPAPTDPAVWTLAEELLRYEHARGLRTRRLAQNAALVPGTEPSLDEHGQIGFPELALAELDWAEWLCHQERQHTWLSRDSRIAVRGRRAGCAGQAGLQRRMSGRGIRIPDRLGRTCCQSETRVFARRRVRRCDVPQRPLGAAAGRVA